MTHNLSCTLGNMCVIRMPLLSASCNKFLAAGRTRRILNTEQHVCACMRSNTSSSALPHLFACCREGKTWLTRIPNTEPLLKTDRYERGSYFVFDTSQWECIRKDNFTLHYDALERQPNLPRSGLQPGGERVVAVTACCRLLSVLPQHCVLAEVRRLPRSA